MLRPLSATLALLACLATTSSARGATAAVEPTLALAPLSPVEPDVPQDVLDARLKGEVTVRVHVTRLGTVDSARVVSGDSRLRSSALAAARWYLYAPRSAPVWTTAALTIDGTVEAEPLPLDVRGMALQAEHARDLRAALDAWAGVLNRCGTHPTIRNPWAIREHIAELARRMPIAPGPRGESEGNAITARIQQQRTVARGEHEDLVKLFDNALRDLPWWDEPYQWESASLIGAGRSRDAMRTMLIFRALSRDSVGRNRADRALAGIAAGDTVVVGEMLKKEGQNFESEQ